MKLYIIEVRQDAGRPWEYRLVTSDREAVADCIGPHDRPREVAAEVFNVARLMQVCSRGAARELIAATAAGLSWGQNRWAVFEIEAGRPIMRAAQPTREVALRYMATGRYLLNVATGELVAANDIEADNANRAAIASHVASTRWGASAKWAAYVPTESEPLLVAWAAEREALDDAASDWPGRFTVNLESGEILAELA